MKKRRLDYTIRFQPFIGTPEEKVLRFIKNHQVSSANALIMQAIRPYWLPLVVLEDDTTPTNIKQQLGRDAVRELQLQVDYICSSLGLEYVSSSICSMVKTEQEVTKGEIQPEHKLDNHLGKQTTAIEDLESGIGEGSWGNLGSFSD
ncbi:MAG: hypothetical protein AAF208_13110 [Cyanobacteria bacterium P01_A01_bin.45]